MDIYDIKGQVQSAAERERRDQAGEWPKILRGPFKSGKVSLSWGQGRIKWFDSLADAEAAAGHPLVVPSERAGSFPGSDEREPERDSEPDRPVRTGPTPRPQSSYTAPTGKPTLAERLSPGRAAHAVDDLKSQITPDFIANARPLSQNEARSYRPKVYRVFRKAFEYADDIITESSRHQEFEHARIWTRIDDDDTYILVDHLLDAGVESKVGAVLVRGISDLWDQFEVGAILAPRFIETWRWYMNHPLLWQSRR